PRCAESVDLDHIGERLADRADGERGVGDHAVLPDALHREILTQRVADDGHRVAARERSRLAREAGDARSAPADLHLHHGNVRGVRDADQSAGEPLAAPRELDRDTPGLPVTGTSWWAMTVDGS